MIEGYYGKVVDNKDPLGIGRVRVKVNGFYDEIATDKIPWAIPKNIAFNRLDPPPMGSEVQVDFIEGEILAPVWFTFNGLSAEVMEIAEDDYISSAVLLYKRLADYGGEGTVRVMFTDTEGLVLEFKKGDKYSLVQLRQDNSVLLKNSNFDKVIHLSNTSISLGTEEESAEPGVMGDKNFDALNNINNTIKAQADIIKTFATQMIAVCAPNSILRGLVSPAKGLLQSTTSDIIGNKCPANEQQFPETKSTIVTTD